MKEKLISKFGELFGGSGSIKYYFAPGRVNLIGEHTDYNGGYVFPCALTIGTYAVARKNTSKKIRFYSMNFENLGVFTCDLDDLEYREEDSWTNYPKGVIWTFIEKGHNINAGFDILYYGTIPNQSGLSSSASIEVLTGFILRDLFHININSINLALYGQYAENNFNGVNCGIMDQFAIAMGKKEQGIFLDTSNLNYEYVPIQLEQAKIVIAASNKKRGLSDSKYNERRNECEIALKELQTVVDIKSLGQLTEEQFEQYQGAIQNETYRKRAKHAVYENARTQKAVNALKENNISEFGQLMNASHTSLRDDYEVTGIELDTLVEASWKQKGVIGSRMTGAGFGGCTISIVETDYIDEFIEEVGKAYKEKIGYNADFYIVQIGDGPVLL